jgi:hypothetical protein
MTTSDLPVPSVVDPDTIRSKTSGRIQTGLIISNPDPGQLRA